MGVIEAGQNGTTFCVNNAPALAAQGFQFGGTSDSDNAPPSHGDSFSRRDLGVHGSHAAVQNQKVRLKHTDGRRTAAKNEGQGGKDDVCLSRQPTVQYDIADDSGSRHKSEPIRIEHKVVQERVLDLCAKIFL